MNIQTNYSLKKYNTFGIDVSAKYFLKADSVPVIQTFLEDKKFNNQPRFILGGGSNILFTKNIDGIVIRNCLKGIELLRQDNDYYYVKTGAGENWHGFVTHCIQNNYAGVENLSLIPGSAGAAPIQNIGAYGVEQKEVFYELQAINMEENKTVTLSKSDCKFGYRDSIFKREVKGKFIITSVTFNLFKTPRPNTSYGAINREMEKMGVKEATIASISQAVCNIRRSKLPDPKKIGNAGSFFKNPTVSSEKYQALKKEYPDIVAYPSPALLVGISPHKVTESVFQRTNPDRQRSGAMKLAAGWLIEQCGWKGKQFGNIGVHKDQALVLVNYGNAKGAEVYELSGKILQSVKEKFGVELEREVVII